MSTSFGNFHDLESPGKIKSLVVVDCCFNRLFGQIDLLFYLKMFLFFKTQKRHCAISNKAWFPLGQLRLQHRPFSSENKAISVLVSLRYPPQFLNNQSDRSFIVK